jgi:hypothetical protein
MLSRGQPYWDSATDYKALSVPSLTRVS